MKLGCHVPIPAPTSVLFVRRPAFFKSFKKPTSIFVSVTGSLSCALKLVVRFSTSVTGSDWSMMTSGLRYRAMV